MKGSRRLWLCVQGCLLMWCLALSASANTSPAVPQWSVYELRLTASGRYHNPYTQAEVRATFTGPGGIRKVVQGFWSGGQTFTIRFAPTVQGLWAYRTASADAGLNQQVGRFQCVAPVASNHGFLRRDAHHPYSFVWDDGTRYFMFGQTYYELVRTAMANGPWRPAVDASQSYGFNKIRLLLYPWPAKETPYGDSQPFKAGDHDALNLPHWEKLDEIVQYLDAKGMVADLILFTDASRAYGTPIQDERYLRYVLARFAAYHHVIWCLTNEWDYTGKPMTYFTSWGRLVRRVDPWLRHGAFLRPLSTHQQTRIDFQFFGSGWPVHAIIQYGLRNGKYHHGDAWGNAGITYNWGHRMPVVNDEYGYIGDYGGTADAAVLETPQRRHRSVIWGIATAGGYSSAGDGRPFGDGVPIFSAVWHDAAEYGDIKRLIDFFTTREIPYWKMSSRNALATSGTRVYVLAETGKHYIIYAAAGGTFSIRLAPGPYEVQQYNPRTGEVVVLPQVTGGRSRSFTMPDGDDWVLWLRTVG
jgi:Domain of unknown function (DUF5060)/Protein of unknown function (DUF4038)/Putative collagen-binding domain of a collagenase